MPRCLRPCLIVLGVLLALVTGAVLAFNIHLQTPAMQERLREGALETIGLPVTVGHVFYTPWDGITLRGLVVPDRENAGINFLEASEFQIRFRLLPLLRREFVVSKVILREAALTWRQNAFGQWRLPQSAEDATVRPVGTPSLAPPTAPPEPVEPLFQVRVENIEVKRSRILFENRDAWPLLEAEGITARTETLEADGDARGRVRVPRAILAGFATARDVRSSFGLQDGRLTFPDIRGDISGGALTGEGSIATREDGSPYEWRLQLSGLQLADLDLPPALLGTDLEGVLATELEISGRNAPQRRVHGRGRLEITGGRLVPAPHIRDLGRLLDIRELRGMDLQTARADFRIEDDFIHVEPLWLQSANLALEVSGTISRAGRLDLQARLLLAPGTARRVASRTGRSWPAAGEGELADYRVLPFSITGTLDDPQSDFATRLLGDGPAGQIGDFLLNIIGNP